MYQTVIVLVLAIVQAKTQISLEYKPVRPFYHPNPGSHLGQIVPPGKPWPESSEGYQGFSQVSSTNIADRIKETQENKVTSNKVEATSPGFTWQSSSTSTTKPQISLEYKPMRPFHQSKPGNTLEEKIPPGKPWPDSPGFTQVVSVPNKIKEPSDEKTTPSGFIWQTDKDSEAWTSTTKRINLNESDFTQPQISLEYQPVRPSFHPNPGSTLGQIIPPGAPLPNANETAILIVSLIDRVKDSVSTSTESTTVRQQQTPISLGYKPTRPFHASNPGNVLSQIVPPGKPWPDSPGFTQVVSIPNKIKDPSDEKTTPSGFVWQTDTNSEDWTSTTKRINLNESDFTQPQISLEYQPMRPSFHPNPGSTLGQIIPPGAQLPNANETAILSLIDRIKDSVSTSTESTTVRQQQTPISLGYKPTRPFYASNPGNVLSQIVPPGKPWPDSPEGYQNFSQTSNPLPFKPEDEKQTTIPDLVDKIKDVSSSTPSSEPQKQTPISLEYQPVKPFHQSKPGNVLQQIVPPGQPWPDNAEDYQNFSQIIAPVPNLVDRTKENTSFATQKPISVENQPGRPSNPNLGDITDIIPPGDPWPYSPDGSQNISQVTSGTVQIEDTSSSTEKIGTSSAPNKQKPISLEYQPMLPSFHPNPGSNLGQIVPPGKPWPNSPEGYQNFSQVSSGVVQLGDRNKNPTSSSTEKIATSSTPSKQKPISLEYQPVRPSFHPNPGSTLGQIVPPGKPWPNSPEGYQNFSQVSSGVVQLGDRNKNPTSSSTEKIGTTTTTNKQTPVSLDFHPLRPFFRPNPVSTFDLEQIIPPGKPWPSSPEGNQNFSAPTLIDNLKELVTQKGPWPNKLEKTTQAGFLWEMETSSGFEESSETSTMDLTTSVTVTVTEGRLYTSAPLEAKLP